MPETPKSAEIGHIAFDTAPFSTVYNTPYEAAVLPGEVPHTQHTVAVTEQHGLQIRTIVEDENLLAQPRRVSGQRKVADVDSFMSELDRRPLTDTGTLWGNASSGVITAVYNDHDGKTAGWRDDQLIVQFKADPDWARWHAISGKSFTQYDFGDLIEELLHTVIDPDQADLLEIIDSIRSSSSGSFQSSINRANGSQTAIYNQEVAATATTTRTGTVEVPQLITLRLRPWEGHAQTYEIQAYFRLRVSGGQLQLSIKLKPTSETLRLAWADVTKQVTAAITKPVYAQP